MTATARRRGRPAAHAARAGRLAVARRARHDRRHRRRRGARRGGLGKRGARRARPDRPGARRGRGVVPAGRAHGRAGVAGSAWSPATSSAPSAARPACSGGALGSFPVLLLGALLARCEQRHELPVPLRRRRPGGARATGPGAVRGAVGDHLRGGPRARTLSGRPGRLAEALGAAGASPGPFLVSVAVSLWRRSCSGPSSGPTRCCWRRGAGRGGRRPDPRRRPPGRASLELGSVHPASAPPCWRCPRRTPSWSR